MSICSVENCERKHFAHGYCNKHYQQIRNHGKILDRTMYDHNPFIIENTICKIKTFNNKNIEVAEGIIDLKYAEIVKSYNLKWHLNSKGYISTVWFNENNQRNELLLHQLIIHLSGKTVQPGEEIDHKDGNPLNCLDNNLRICNRSQNQQNCKLPINNTSGFKGVTWYKYTKKWLAQITVNNKNINLGYYDIKEDAARAYNDAAIKYFGEFAQLNIIP